MKTVFTSLFFTFAVCCPLFCGPLFAQEELEIEAFSFSNEDGSSPPIIMMSESFDGGTTSQMRVISGADGISGFGGFSGGMSIGGGGDEFSMLQNPSVQKDLEMVDGQLEQIMEMQRKHSEQLAGVIGNIEDGFSLENVDQLKEMFAELKAKQKADISAMLLPHQQERLKQVALQMKMQSQGTANALINAQVAEQLGITDEQKERLQTRSEELKAEMEKQIEELRARAKEDLLSELTQEQRDQLQGMIGDAYEVNNDDWREGIQRRLKERIDRGEDR